jgi:hypothetical protein
MARKRHKPEEIVAKLRQVHVLTCRDRWVHARVPGDPGLVPTYAAWPAAQPRPAPPAMLRWRPDPP